MLTLTQRLPANSEAIVSFTLWLSAEERTHSRQRVEAANGQVVALHLPRGTVLRDGDLLSPETAQEHDLANHSSLVRVVAKPEPVLTATAQTSLELVRAAYHLGNRHVPLEITDTYLRLSPDPVLKTMLEHLGLQVQEDIQPFQPETGAYGHHSH